MTALAFVVAAGVTYALRGAVTVAGRPAPRWLDAIAGFVTPAILASMVASSMLLHGADRQVELPSVAVAAAAAATFLVARRRNLALGLAAGMPVFWAAAALGLS